MINQVNSAEFNKLKIGKISSKPKKTFKSIVNKAKKHKYHRSLQYHLSAVHSRNKHKSDVSSCLNGNHSESSVKTSKTDINISIDDKNICDNEMALNENNTLSENKTVFNQIDNVTVTNGTVLNDTNEGNETIFNQTGNKTVENETNINGTDLNSTTGETIFNQTNCSTQNSSTKDNVLNTLQNVGYALAAIAACLAVATALDVEPTTKTGLAVAAIVVGAAAAVCFVACAVIKWFNW